MGLRVIDISTKNKRGFTLLEVIISIATLSLISLFILQMFMASSDLNNRAKNTDAALTKAITEIEKIKGGQRPAPGTTFVYYDEKWLPTNGSGGAAFVQEIFVSPDSAGSLLYVINSKVWDYGGGEKTLLLSELQAKKYFPNETEAAR